MGCLIPPLFIMDINYIAYVHNFIYALMLLFVPLAIYHIHEDTNNYKFVKPKPLKKTKLRIKGLASDLWINYSSTNLISLGYFYIDKHLTMYLDPKRFKGDDVNYMFYCTKTNSTFIFLNLKRVVVYSHKRDKVVLDENIKDLGQTPQPTKWDIDLVRDNLFWRFL